MSECYGILRDGKLHWSDVKKLQAEMQRVLETHTMELKDFNHSLIDWSKTSENVFLVKTEDWKKEIDELCDFYDCKRKKDSVVAINCVYAITPEWLKNHSEAEAMDYFKKCYEFHVKEFCKGNEELMLCFVIHKDETSWHAHACSCPILHHKTVNKRSKKVKEYYSLDAKSILGNRLEHSKRQDRFYNEVSKQFGLERGIPKPISRRKHYDQMDKNLKTLNEIERLSKSHTADALDRMEQTLKICRERALSIEEQTAMLKEIVELSHSIKAAEKVLEGEYSRLQKNYIYREWKILQERYPQIAKLVHQENIELRKSENDYLPRTSSNDGMVRNIKDNTNENVR